MRRTDRTNQVIWNTCSSESPRTELASFRDTVSLGINVSWIAMVIRTVLQAKRVSFSLLGDFIGAAISQWGKWPIIMIPNLDWLMSHDCRYKERISLQEEKSGQCLAKPLLHPRQHPAILLQKNHCEPHSTTAWREGFETYTRISWVKVSVWSINFFSLANFWRIKLSWIKENLLH